MDEAAITAHPGGAPFSRAHSDAPIVVGIHHPREETGRSLILQAHVDVVPTGPGRAVDACAVRPRDRGRLALWPRRRRHEGRACARISPASTRCGASACSRPRRSMCESVVEEESTGNGALMTHLRGYRADAALIPEPEYEMLARANAGVIWFQFEVRGVPVHVREMGAGANAIDAAYRVDRRAARARGRVQRREGRPRAFRGTQDHPINLNIGKIEGGDWASSVPCWCQRRLPRRAVSRHQRAGDRRSGSRTASALLRAQDAFLANNPPQGHASTASGPRAMCCSPAARRRPCSAAPIRPRSARRCRAS